MFAAILFEIFCTAVIIQLGYLLLFCGKIKPAPLRTALPAVSVVICARNEAVNLQQFLPDVLQQEYPEDLFEVIVVDDGSTDATAAVLAALSKQYRQLRVLSLPAGMAKDLPGKKYALAQGIAAATFDTLLLTDADCRPAGKQWLRRMTEQDTPVVLGYGAYRKEPDLLNLFTRWETVHTCMQYMSYAANEWPYMGVGRNLSYSKNLLQQLEGDTTFQEQYRNTPSGDDDLVISKIARDEPVGLCTGKDGLTISPAKKTWKEWWHQKTRHVSTGKYYPANIKNLLGLYAASHAFCWLGGLLLLVLALYGVQFPVPAWGIGLVFLLRLLPSWINAINWYRKLNEKGLLFFYPLGDLGWALYNVLLSPYILWKNRQAWK